MSGIGANASDADKIIYVGITNHPDSLDKAIRSRFREGIEIDVPKPSVEKYKLVLNKILERCEQKYKCKDNPISFTDISDQFKKRLCGHMHSQGGDFRDLNSYVSQVVAFYDDIEDQPCDEVMEYVLGNWDKAKKMEKEKGGEKGREGRKRKRTEEETK